MVYVNSILLFSLRYRLLQKLHSIKCVNSGGHAIVALVLYRWLKNKGIKCELYHDSYKIFIEVENRFYSSFTDNNVDIGNVLPMSEFELVRLLNDPYFGWRRNFNRQQINRIQSLSKIDLSDIK